MDALTRRRESELNLDAESQQELDRRPGCGDLLGMRPEDSTLIPVRQLSQRCETARREFLANHFPRET